MTPVSASLQSDLNSTDKSRRNVDTNSLIEKLENNTPKHSNATSDNKSHINKSVDLSADPMFINKGQMLDELSQILDYSKKHNITVTDGNNTILGTMIRITSINDLKPGDIITYYHKVTGLIKTIPYYLLITSIKGTGKNTRYAYYTTDLQNSSIIIQYTNVSQEVFKGLFGYDVEGGLVFRADPSLYNLTDNNTTIHPDYGGELEVLLRNFNNFSIEVDNNDHQLIPSTAKDLWWLWSLIPGVTTAVQLPFTLKLIAEKYRKCCCGTPSSEEIILLKQTRELSRLSEATGDMRVTIERLNGNIRSMDNDIEVARVQTELRLISDDIGRIEYQCS